MGNKVQHIPFGESTGFVPAYLPMAGCKYASDLSGKFHDKQALEALCTATLTYGPYRIRVARYLSIHKGV